MPSIEEDFKQRLTKVALVFQDHIGSLNWGYRVQLRDKKVTYTNAYAKIVDKHTIKVATIIVQKLLISTQ